MLSTPLVTQDSIKAETAYRLERAKRDYRPWSRRPRKERTARRTLRYTKAA
ncbi:hypothetical protein AB0E69_02875 [Kribbella sp. NPDC026611]|uniref:hypothetical protein n=1 Tax=Kribbella sp. NPDC026611 TaxID=3154911 RepID=UPI0033DCA89C